MRKGIVSWKWKDAENIQGNISIAVQSKNTMWIIITCNAEKHKWKWKVRQYPRAIEPVRIKRKMKQWNDIGILKSKNMYSCSYPRPTYPRASTFENATVGAGVAPKPMKDLVLPLDLKVETRGVDRLGKGTASDVNVIVEGVRVRVVKVGEGGKTNNVCEGVETAGIDSTMPTDALRKTLLRRWSGGTGQRNPARWRADGVVPCEVGRAVTSSSATGGFREEGTGGRILRLKGRFLCLGTRVGGWKVERIADIGGVAGGTFQSGAYGKQVWGLAGIDANLVALSVSSVSSGEVVVEVWRASPSDSPPTPSNSCSSFSSTRCSLRKLLFVLILAMDSVRLQGM